MLIDRLYQDEWIDQDRLRSIFGSKVLDGDIGSLTLSEKVKLVSDLTSKRKAINAVLDEDGVIGFLSGNLVSASKPDLCSHILRAQKLMLSREFVECSLMKLATPETVVKAKQWFRLIHNPLVMEWEIQCDTGTDGQQQRSLKVALLMWQELERAQIDAVLFDGVKGGYEANRFSFNPASLGIDDKGEVAIDVSADSESEINVFNERICKRITELAVDFLIRINSKDITDIGPRVDFGALNKKRQRNGRLPVFEYHVVDLAGKIKADLRQVRVIGDDRHSRLHWRRGHFKCRKTGIFWWNPHLAGSNEAGIVGKHYVASC